MAVVKYTVKEFTPNENQVGMGHSFYAEAVVDNVITNKQLAAKIEARGVARASLIKSVLEEAANIIQEEVMENNRVQLEGNSGVLVSLEPSCQGSVTDKYVREHQSEEKYAGKSVATADMLTADMIKWNILASVGRNFAKQFDQQKQTKRVGETTDSNTDPNQEENPEQGGGDNNGGGNNDMEG